MRRFTQGSATDGKIVVIDLDLDGTRMTVVQKMADGTKKRSVKELSSEAEAHSASEQLARQLISRGFIERAGREPNPAGNGARVSKSAAAAKEREKVSANPAFDDLEAPAAQPLPRLARLDGTQPSSDDAPKKKKKKGGKKKKKSGQGGDSLDKRVLAGVGAVGLAIVCGLGYVIYDGFIKPPVLFANWQGGMVDHEISKHLTITQYVLILNDKNRAELTIVEHNPWIGVGTYTLKGDRLKLTLTDGLDETTEREYKIALARSTLELYDPANGKLLVQLLRQRTPPVVRAKAPPITNSDGIGGL